MNIDEIKNAFTSGIPVEYKMHCLKRMLERDISRKDVENCIFTGEIIEDYPLDESNASASSYPSCLILGMSVQGNDAIHVVVGYNESTIIIITAYHPDLEHLEKDFKTRRVEYV